jgi:hypothetical protein
MLDLTVHITGHRLQSIPPSPLFLLCDLGLLHEYLGVCWGEDWGMTMGIVGRESVVVVFAFHEGIEKDCLKGCGVALLIVEIAMGVEGMGMC